MNELNLYNEIDLQKKVHLLISNPSIIRNTIEGKRIQILSPGTHNNLEGPDFLDLAMMIDSQIIIGDAEFHRNSSDWNKHRHYLDPKYNKVVLHIILNNDLEINNKFHTLLINKNDLELCKNNNFISNINKPKNEINVTNEIEILHQYALNRIIRKTTEIKKVLDNNEFLIATKIIVKKFIERYLSLRRRPSYTTDSLIIFLDKWENTEFYKFLIVLNSDGFNKIPDGLVALLKDKSSGIGPSLRREIILNCIIPIALAISEEDARINLFLWYWSTPSLNTYGLLKKKFPSLPQNFLWQQQGMLEYNKVYGSKKNNNTENASDYLINFSLGEILDFYHIGQNPYLKEK